MRPPRHAKTDSEVTSIDASSPPRSPRRPLYYVESPSPQEMEKLSFNSSPAGSPPPPNHHNHNLQSYHYRSSPIHHSRESSTSRFSSASLKHPYPAAWKRMRRVADGGVAEDDEDDDFIDDDERDPNRKVRLACLFVLGFVIMFSLFSLILWGASKAYRPLVTVQHVVFRSFDVHAGMDYTGVATEMLSLNSTVAISYANRGTFFGLHVSSTPWELYCYQLKVASGEMKEFYEERKRERRVVTVVSGHQVPVYGAVTAIKDAREMNKFVLPMNLTLKVRSRAYILGKLVRSKFYNQIRCPVTLQGDKFGKKLNVSNCVNE
uniref:Late embryogenesis abundant protein LEA-2 subgroup domain-containing protein n=1 Tax=Kalanchoe fedtschenkoi TaxID=63787 RepID=A0A7N0V951_KALFE